MDAMKMLKDSYHIMVKDLIELKRNRMSLAAMFIMPLVFLGMFGFIFPSGNTQQNMPVGLVDLDQGQGSAEFITQLETLNKNASYMKFENFSSVDAAKTAINRGKLDGTFIIPQGFSYNLTHGQSANVIIYVDNSNPQIATAIEGVASSTISGLNGIKAETNVLQMGKSTNQIVNPQAVVFPYTPNVQTTIPGQTNYFNFLAPGLMIMIVMMAVMTGIPEAISKEKEIGTFDGMLSAPISQMSIILGKTAALCTRGSNPMCDDTHTGYGPVWRYNSGKSSAGILHAYPWYIQLHRPWNHGHINGQRSGIWNHDNEPVNDSYDVPWRHILPDPADAMVHAGYLTANTIDLCCRCHA